jgi:hypothetical protein
MHGFELVVFFCASALPTKTIRRRRFIQRVIHFVSYPLYGTDAIGSVHTLGRTVARRSSFVDIALAPSFQMPLAAIFVEYRLASHYSSWTWKLTSKKCSDLV